MEAQRDREFFFRPKTPPVWRPDAHLRFKKWSVEELKAVLLGEEKKSEAWRRDLYKTRWRGVTVKEVALNLEVENLIKNQNLAPEEKTPLLRRAFSMSSTLSQVKEREMRLMNE